MIKNNLEKEINRYKLKTTGASLNSRLKMLLLVVGASTTIGLLIVLGLLWTMPPLPKREITDEICLSDISGQLVCGKTEYRLYEYTKEVSLLKYIIDSIIILNHKLCFGVYLCPSVYSIVFNSLRVL